MVSAKAVSGSDVISLRQSAESAALKAIFSPTRLSGQPVKVSGVIVYNFVAEKTNEEALKALGISTFLSITRLFASDLGKLKEVFEGYDLIKDGISEFPEFADEFRTLVSLEKIPAGDRVGAIDAALVSIRSKSSESDRWQIEVGKNLGEIIGPLMQFASSGYEPSDLDKLDQTKIKLALTNIYDLTLSTPADFPQDVSQKLRSLAGVGTKENLVNEANFQDFFTKIEGLLEVISPGSTR